MTKKQKDKIIKVIKNDATLRHIYALDDKACVIGGLCLAAGYPKKKLIGMDKNSISNSLFEDVWDLLNKVFGLTRFQLKDLQSINDYYDRTTSRREALIETVKSYETND